MSVSPAVSFEEAIALTQSLLSELEQQQLSDADLKAAVLNLVQSRAGARGFFVGYLTDSRSLADVPSPPIVTALQSAPETVNELLVKNLAMSTAMAIAHQRNQDAEMAAQSERVQRRTAQLLKQVQTDAIEQEARQLWQSLQGATGDYSRFLKKWGYDAAQQQAIAAQLSQVFPQLA